LIEFTQHLILTAHRYRIATNQCRNDNGARSLELRAATSLYQLTRSAEDHQQLSEIYDFFTEGFDTADLRQAKIALHG
jgi:hypothetical protein